MMLTQQLYSDVTNLSQSLLTSPHRGVDNLEEQLSSTRVEHKYGSIDWLCCQITFKCLLWDICDKLVTIVTYLPCVWLHGRH